MPASLPITRTWTIPAGGEALLTDIINNTDYLWVTYVMARADRDNAGDVQWEDADGQVGGYMGPGEAVALGDEYGSTQMLGFKLTGTEGDVVYLTIGISLGSTWLG